MLVFSSARVSVLSEEGQASRYIRCLVLHRDVLRQNICPSFFLVPEGGFQGIESTRYLECICHQQAAKTRFVG